MKTFWRKQMQENTSQTNHNNYTFDCECCHCKKFFMAFVILILTFMAGIMVGNNGRCHYSDTYYAKNSSSPYNQKKKFHRGLHLIPPTTNTNSPDQAGGFIIEIDQSN